MKQNPILTCRNISKSYHKNGRMIPILRSINLQVHAGEIIAIQGRSGAGKSTLLSILGGLTRPDSGMLLFEEHQMHACTPRELTRIRQQGIGLIFQNHNLISTWTALENVQAGVIGADARHIDSILKRLGLDERLDHFPHELSIGEQQRTAVARILAKQPELILADEPAGDVDDQTGDEIISQLAHLALKNDAAVIIATHGHFPLERCDRVFELCEGGLGGAIYMQPHH